MSLKMTNKQLSASSNLNFLGSLLAKNKNYQFSSRVNESLFTLHNSFWFISIKSISLPASIVIHHSSLCMHTAQWSVMRT